MEPNWNRLWRNAHRKMCNKDEFVTKFNEVHNNSDDYYYEYISGDEWNNSTPDEVYFKIKKKSLVDE
tara:strand:+ start:193 stop:393 length:201 start_codon:yes stop_codon:yes gene_type:complete